jgi:cytochrome c-type biogenesis protein CcmE
LFFLFSWTGLPAVVSLVEGIVFLVVSEMQFREMTVGRGDAPVVALAPAAFLCLLPILGGAYLASNAWGASRPPALDAADVDTRQGELAGEWLEIAGVVVGETIRYDASSNTLTFQLTGSAVSTDSSGRLSVVYLGPQPTLLVDRARVNVRGRLDEAGVFHADELLIDWRSP